VRAPITAFDAGASGTGRRWAFGGFFGATRTGLVAGRAFGSPTSRPSGGGSGARSRLGTSRSAIIITKTIAATRATLRHLIRTLATARQGVGGPDLSPVP
jgi:hypothetical protein